MKHVYFYSIIFLNFKINTYFFPDICYYPHTSRNLVPPVCRMKKKIFYSFFCWGGMWRLNIVRNHPDGYPYLNLSKQTKTSTNYSAFSFVGNLDYSMNAQTPRRGDHQKFFYTYTYSFNTLHKLDPKLGHRTQLNNYKKKYNELLHKNFCLQNYFVGYL